MTHPLDSDAVYRALMALGPTVSLDLCQQLVHRGQMHVNVLPGGATAPPSTPQFSTGILNGIVPPPGAPATFRPTLFRSRDDNSVPNGSSAVKHTVGNASADDFGIRYPERPHGSTWTPAAPNWQHDQIDVMMDESSVSDHFASSPITIAPISYRRASMNGGRVAWRNTAVAASQHRDQLNFNSLVNSVGGGGGGASPSKRRKIMDSVDGNNDINVNNDLMCISISDSEPSSPHNGGGGSGGDDRQQDDDDVIEVLGPFELLDTASALSLHPSSSDDRDRSKSQRRQQQYRRRASEPAVITSSSSTSTSSSSVLRTASDDSDQSDVMMTDTQIIISATSHFGSFASFPSLVPEVQMGRSTSRSSDSLDAESDVSFVPGPQMSIKERVRVNLALPIIVFDTANIAFSDHDHFRAELIQIAGKYFQDRGYRVRCIINEYFLNPRHPKGRKVDLPEYLHFLLDNGLLAATPEADYDDSYMLRFAIDNSAYVVSNDHFRDQDRSGDATMRQYRVKLRIGFKFMFGKSFVPIMATGAHLPGI